MHRLLLLAAVVALFAAAPAHATTIVLDDGGMSNPQPFQSWVDSALVPTPQGTVTLRLTPCDDDAALGCSSSDGRLIEIDPGWMRPHVVLHELGHVFDDDMPAWGRAAFTKLTHRRDAWDGPSEDNPPSEQFAEAYALCARHARLHAQYFAQYHYAPTPRMHRRACALIRQLGA